MGKKTKLGKTRLDRYYHLAKEQGYRSRAAFKLIQLNRKFDFLSSARSLLDLCAAPGGWLQVAVKEMPVSSLVLGVDLAPIKPIRGAKTLVGDITTQKARLAIRKESGGRQMDVVLCDGAPNVGGAWATETYSQNWLALEALKLATDVLAPKGVFVTKIFRSKDYSALLYAFKQLFDKVDATKPAASRNTSAEIFVVCRGYKAPSRIDPRLLDSRHLFQEVEEPAKVAGPDALLKEKIKQRRFREGYAEGISSSHKPLPAAAFISGDSPVEMLGQCTTLVLNGPGSEAEVAGVEDTVAVAAAIRSHPATTAEVKLLCADLQVLGRSEFKQLLKWRLLVKKDLQKQLAQGPAAAAAAAAAEAGEGSDGEAGGEGEPEDAEERLLREMTEVQDKMEKRRKRERRKRKEAKNKSWLRAAQLSQAEGIGLEEGPERLFTLSGIKGKSAAGSVADANVPDSDAALSSSDGDMGQEEASSGNSDEDSEEEQQRKYDALMDAYLEETYQTWKERQRGAGDGAPKRKRRRLGRDGELSDEEDGEGIEALPSSESEEEDEEEEQEAGGGLIVTLDERRAGVPASAPAAAAQWFSQELFADADLEDDEEEQQQQQPAAASRQQRKAAQQQQQQQAAEGPASKRRKGAAAAGGGGGAVAGTTIGSGAPAQAAAAGSEEDEDDLEPGTAAARRRQRGAGRAAAAAAEAERGEGFEVVAGLGSGSDGSSESEDEFEGMDDAGKAEVLALAKKMLRRKVKDNIIEAAYNRYAFHDIGLPKWFNDDERKHMRPVTQITGDEYREAKEQLRAIDARPIKKVAEARARKRKRLQTRLTQARQKAEAIAGQEDIPMKSKMRDIEKLYAKARSGKGAKKRTSRSDQYKSKGRPLDPRMRSDKRGMDKVAKRMKGSKKGPAPAGGGGGPKGGKAGKNRRR